MSGYAKLFSSIVTSTIWSAPDHVRILWVTMMALADRDGVVEGSIPGLAAVARITVDQAVEAIKVLSSPDKYSRTKTLQGRRVVPVPGGWRLVTYEKYREKGSQEEAKAKTAARVARWKLRHKGNAQVTASNRETRLDTPTNPIAEADPEAKADPDPERGGAAPPPSDLDSLWILFHGSGNGLNKRETFDRYVKAVIAKGRGVTIEVVAAWIREHPGSNVLELHDALAPKRTESRSEKLKRELAELRAADEAKAREETGNEVADSEDPNHDAM